MVCPFLATRHAAGRGWGDDDTLCGMEARPLHFHSGEPVFWPGDPAEHLYLVLRGAVRLSNLDPCGEETTVALVAPGEIFGACSLILGETHRHLAAAVGETSLCSVSAASVGWKLSSSPVFPGLIMQALAGRTRQAQDFAAIRSYTSVSQRLAHLFKVLARDFGTSMGSHIVVNLSLTHEDLAHMVSVTRPNVSRHLENLRRHGLVAFRGRTIHLDAREDLYIIGSQRGKALYAAWQCDRTEDEAALRAG